MRVLEINRDRRYRNITSIFLLVAFISFLGADLSITTLDPFTEISKFFLSISQISFTNIGEIFEALITTVAVALTSLIFSVIFGFILSIYFRYKVVATSLAVLRSIHELFWALIFLQIFGLTALTGILAIIIPYSAILAKVYAEILEEKQHIKRENFPKGVTSITFFLFAKLPDALPEIWTYTSYRFECALKSSAILGFIGLGTLGFFLESSFMQGYYNEVWLILILFYILVATIKYWLNKFTFLPLLIFLITKLDFSAHIETSNIIRFFTEDIVPYPIKEGGGIVETFNWAKEIFLEEALTGIYNTFLVTQISLVATGIVALLLFPFISNKMLGKKSTFFGNILLVVLRSTPEYILAYLFLQLWGPSMLPAIVALMLHNGAIIAHLVGNSSNTLKLRVDLPKKRNDRYFYEILPRIYPTFLAFLFYRWEVIMRESAILGILGVQTLGFFIDSAISEFALDKMFFLLMITALLNILVDKISRQVRNYLRIKHKINNSCNLL
ncbi:MAG: hypothetical protein OIF32_03465 [Campylobacterales bacterium]|nr:hypothetical protein [Campylobacterales bacterium]